MENASSVRHIRLCYIKEALILNERTVLHGKGIAKFSSTDPISKMFIFVMSLY